MRELSSQEHPSFQNIKDDEFDSTPFGEHNFEYDSPGLLTLVEFWLLTLLLLFIFTPFYLEYSWFWSLLHHVSLMFKLGFWEKIKSKQ